MDDGENGFLLGWCAHDCGIEEASRCLKSVEESRGEIGMFVGALRETRVSELAEDCKLAAEEEDAVVDIVQNLLWFGYGLEDHGFFVKSFLFSGDRGVSRWASHAAKVSVCIVVNTTLVTGNPFPRKSLFWEDVI